MPVKVIPRARETALEGEIAGSLKVRLANPPVDGKANAECIRFVARVFGLRPSGVELVKGAASSRKTLLLTGISLENAESTLIRLLRQSDP